MKNTFIILPNQLFKKIDTLKNYDIIYIWEHPTFFTKYKYHKLKLVYHRCTMSSYFEYLKSNLTRSNIIYIPFYKKIPYSKNDSVTIYDPIDFSILKEFRKYNANVLESKLFILTSQEIHEYTENTEKKEKKKFVHHHFYKWIRIKKNILIDKNQKPVGGKWSFDMENRHPFDKKYKESPPKIFNNNEIKTNATEYVQKHFPNNPGSFDSIEIYAIDFKSAEKVLNHFIKHKLKYYGKYQDAVRSDVIFGHHSVLSPMINIGLLNPNDIVQKVIKAQKKKSYNIPLSSVEGYLRQLLSWREYVRMLYILKNDVFQKNNFFDHKNKITKEWYNGTTQIQPIDDIIKKVLKYSYAHHIERLMFLGNFMLLCQFHPKEVYKWFISLASIDAYEWVMVPNIYGMSQFSVGPLMMTRPYFSSSNYIIKMSDYTKKSGDFILLEKKKYYWSDIWNALYYFFIYKNQKFLAKNYSTANAVSNWKKKSLQEKREIIQISKLFLYSS